MALSETLSVCDARRQWLSHRHFGQHQTARAIVHEQEGAWHMLGGEEPGSGHAGLTRPIGVEIAQVTACVAAECSDGSVGDTTTSEER
jgi:hypothetical protein